MMNPPIDPDNFDPAELWALIDGELPAQRAAAVRRAIERDPLLRARFHSIAQLHARWTADAAAASFSPAHAPAPGVASAGAAASAARGWVLSGVVTLLVCLRLGGRLLPLMLNLGMHLAALVLILAVALVLLVRAEANEREQARIEFL